MTLQLEQHAGLATVLEFNAVALDWICEFAVQDPLEREWLLRFGSSKPAPCLPKIPNRAQNPETNNTTQADRPKRRPNNPQALPGQGASGWLPPEC